MGRNSGGTYTSPIPPFVPGTTIKTQEMNPKFQDIYDALSDSLSRTGQGNMQAPLRVPDGSAAVPSLTFTSDTGTGLYRSAPYTVRMVSQAATLQEWALTYVNINRPLTIDNTTPNAVGLTVYGNGTGVGINVTGGTPSGNAPGARGIVTEGGAGAGSGGGGTGLFTIGGAAGGAGGGVQGLGLESTGGIAGIAAPLDAAGTVRPTRYYAASAQLPATANAIFPLNGLAWTNAVGVNNVGLDVYTRSMGTLAGWQTLRFGLRYDVDLVPGAGGMLEFGDSGTSIARGSAATATSPGAALTLVNAHLGFATTVVPPASTTAVRDAVTPANIIKAKVRFRIFVGAPPTITVSTGFNVTSVTITTPPNGLDGQFTVNFAQPFSGLIDWTWGPISFGVVRRYWIEETGQTTTSVTFRAYYFDSTGGNLQTSPLTSGSDLGATIWFSGLQ